METVPDVRTRKPDTARFAELATTLKLLADALAVCDEAETIHQSLPRRYRDQIDASIELPEANIAHALARTRKEPRAEYRERVQRAVHGLEELLIDKEFIPGWESEELDLIIDFIDGLRMLGPRSRLGLVHFFAAMKANDHGTLVAVTLPGRGNARQKLEMRFTHGLSPEMHDALAIPRDHS